jgi:hypothetical protein
MASLLAARLAFQLDKTGAAPIAARTANVVLIAAQMEIAASSALRPYRPLGTRKPLPVRIAVDRLAQRNRCALVTAPKWVPGADLFWGS